MATTAAAQVVSLSVLLPMQAQSITLDSATIARVVPMDMAMLMTASPMVTPHTLDPECEEQHPLVVVVLLMAVLVALL